jgi:hypothetical protein
MKKLLKTISKKFKFSISKQSIYYVLKNNKITHKRTKENHYPYDSEKLKEELNKTNNELKEVNYNVISTDESALYFYTKGNYGWSEKGTECEVKGHIKVKKMSLVMSVSKDKIIGYTLKQGSFNAKSFNKFMMSKNKNNDQHLKSFVDNARIHHAKCLNNKIKSNIIYNVPYYSKFNPIEMVFNSLKRYLGTVYICSLSSLRRHINIFIEKLLQKNYLIIFQRHSKC